MNRGSNQSRVLTAVAVYLPEQYPRLLAIADDASRLEPTWQAWHQNLQETKQMASEQGINLIEMTVDLDALEQYCQERGLTNTSSTRAQFAAHLLSEAHQQYTRLHPPIFLKRRSKHKKRRSR
ncbi:MAG: hypothetical protein J2P37_11600 [Ktedonobacteraceae bacterium]|nr:hypothetical protein [Ktedonobacteraceae bacterium]